VIDGGYCGFEPSTVISMVDDIEIVRQGLGRIDDFVG
jgi:tRNA A37 threonylcarbamoyladenosine synthetase subunit TsaC/SUA5/YrdC